MSTKKIPPARTPEAQEQKMINLAMKQAEQQLMEGTASSQIVVHFLRLATVNTELEREKLRAETDLAKAKVDAMKTAETSGALYEEAMNAFREYQGGYDVVEDYDN